MRRHNRPRRTRSVLLLSLVFLSAFGISCSEKTKTEGQVDGLQARKGEVLPSARVDVPEDVLLCAVMGNPLNFTKRLQELAEKTAPLPPGAFSSALSEGLLGMGLKDPRAVELYRPAGMLILNPRKYGVPMVLALAVKSEDSMIESFKPAWAHKAVQDGIHELTRHDVNTYDVFKGGAASAGGGPPQSIFVRFSDRMAYLAVERPALLAGAPVLQAQLEASAPADGLQAAIFVDGARKAFAMELSALPLMLKKQLESVLSRKTHVANIEASLWMAGWMLDKSLALVQQSRHLALAIDLRPTEGRLLFALEPEAGSFLETFLKEQKKQELRLDRGLPGKGFLSLGFNLQWESVREDAIAFVAELIKRFSDQESAEPFIQVTRQLLQVLGDEMAMAESIDADHGMSLIHLTSVKDEVQAGQAVSKAMELASKILSGMEPNLSMGAKFDGPFELPAHDGVALQRYSIRFAIDSLPAAQAQALREMYGGDTLMMVVGVVDKTLLWTMGSEAPAEAQITIDRLRGRRPGLDKSRRRTEAAGDLGEKTNGYILLSLAEAISSSIRATLSSMGAQAPKVNLPESRSAFFINIGVDNRRLHAALRLPAVHLEEIGRVFQLLAELSVAPAGSAQDASPASPPKAPRTPAP